MARSFLLHTLALSVATAIVFARAIPASAQPAVPSTPAAATPAKPQYPEVQEAVKALSERRVGDAFKLLEEAARKYPELPPAHIIMYQFLVQMKQFNAARLELEKAVVANPSDPESWVILGSIAMNEHRIAESEMDFAEAQQLLAKFTNPKRKPIIERQDLAGIAQVAEVRENWKVAQARLEELLKLAPDDLVARQRLARALFWQSKVTEAYDALKEAKAIDVKNAAKKGGREVFLTPEAILAQYYDQFEGFKSKTGNAEKWYKVALKKAPNDLATRQAVAIWALERGMIPFAKEQAEAALKIEKEDALGKNIYKGSLVGRMLCGLVALWEKKWDAAEGYFENVILQDPTNFVARNNIALALVEQDSQTKKDLAKKYAYANWSDNKENADALSTLAWVYFRRGEIDQARLAMEQSIKATGGQVTNPDTATYLAYILNQTGAAWQAKEVLNNILAEGGRPFSMKPEAKELLARVKDAVKPEKKTP